MKQQRAAQLATCRRQEYFQSGLKGSASVEVVAHTGFDLIQVHPSPQGGSLGLFFGGPRMVYTGGPACST